jgi:hypothetical protein
MLPVPHHMAQDAEKKKAESGTPHFYLFKRDISAWSKEGK